MDHYRGVESVFLRKFVMAHGSNIEGVVELSNAKNVQVTKDLSDPRAWKWHITWD